MQKLGIKDRPEYEGREYEEHETKNVKSSSISEKVKTSLT
jgi:hypothetical protein